MIGSIINKSRSVNTDNGCLKWLKMLKRKDERRKRGKQGFQGRKQKKGDENRTGNAG